LEASGLATCVRAENNPAIVIFKEAAKPVTGPARESPQVSI
jgi:hypothetical protein